jgi:hypothetical protein
VAAHLRPCGGGGAHETGNGPLFRSDIQRLFDRFCVTVSTDGRLEASRRIRAAFGIGPEPCPRKWNTLRHCSTICSSP